MMTGMTSLFHTRKPPSPALGSNTKRVPTSLRLPSTLSMPLPLRAFAHPFRLAHARAGSPLDTLWSPMSETSCCRCGRRSRSIVPLWQTHGGRIRKSGTACADVRTLVPARPFWCEEWHVQPGLGRISAHRSHAPIGFSRASRYTDTGPLPGGHGAAFHCSNRALGAIRSERLVSSLVSPHCSCS